jgi:Tfp pilus assembly protein PilN
MPLTLNLLHEEQKQLKARKRDPLKLGLLGMVGLALLFVAYYAYRLLSGASLESDLKQRQATWAKQEPLAAAAEAQEKSLNLSIAAAAVLTKRIEERFYWAPLLETIVKTVPPGIQLTGMSGSSDPKNEKITLSLEGIAAAAEPREGAEQFRKALIESLGKKYPGADISFKTLEEAPATVNLDGKTLPTARFAMDVQFPRKPAAPAAPAPVLRPRR